MAKRDINQLAKLLVDITTESAKDINENKKPNTNVIGRAGGKVSGKERDIDQCC